MTITELYYFFQTDRKKGRRFPLAHRVGTYIEYGPQNTILIAGNRIRVGNRQLTVIHRLL